MIALSATECLLINTEAFLRLHRIKQLSHAYVAFPSALHTRYEHSLGAMHVAGLMCKKLELDSETTRLVRIAALLHDIGHGPFSHLFEEVLGPINSINGSVHEHITRLIIKDDPEIKKILGNDRYKIIKILNENKSEVEPDLRLMSDIVSSSLDADKLDYLARDSYYLGVNYGKFDLVRILHTICPIPNNERLGIQLKGMHALENYRLARHLMTVQVNKHHTRLAADQMFLNAVRIAIDIEKIIPKNRLRVNSKSFLRFYKTLDDCSIVNLILSDKKPSTSGTILRDIRARKLLKRVYKIRPMLIKDDDGARREFLYQKDKLSSIAEDIRKQLKLPDHMLFVYESKMPIKLYGTDDIPCVDDEGKTFFMHSASPFRVEAGVLAYYVFGPESKRETIRKRFAARDIGA